MIKTRGFVLLEVVVLIFLVIMISLTVSKLMYNNNKMFTYLKNDIRIDTIANNEAYRAKIGLQPETYSDIIIEKHSTVVNQGLGLDNVTLEYIDVVVINQKFNIQKKVTVVRRLGYD